MRPVLQIRLMKRPTSLISSDLLCQLSNFIRPVCHAMRLGPYEGPLFKEVHFDLQKNRNPYLMSISCQSEKGWSYQFFLNKVKHGHRDITDCMQRWTK